MREMQAAIGIKMDQRTGLIEMGLSKGNTEFHRGQCQSFFKNGRLLVKACNLLPPCPVIGCLFQLLDDAPTRNGGLHLHAIRRQGAVMPVEIDLAHIKRILSRFGSDRLHHRLDGQYGFRGTETTKGGIGNRMSAQALRPDPR